MDYYTYQKQFTDNLNEFITQQCPTNIINETFNQYSNCTQINLPCYTNIPAIPSQVYDLSLPPPVTNIDVKADDELWIETWLSQIGKIQINLNSTIAIHQVPEPIKPVKNVIQVHAAKMALKNCFEVLDKLQEMQEHLKANVACMSTTEWKNQTMEIGLIKDQFSKLISPFERPEIVTQLRLAVERRRKKRKTIGQRKKNRKECLAEILDTRQKLHKDIDRWLESMKDEVERTKIEENMKKEADSVLSEVNKKKSDARKLHSLITSLVKLRYVREQTAIQRGDKVSLDDAVAFAKATEHLTKIWNDELNVYGKEEQGLRMMLEETAVEDNNAARIAKERKITQEWDAVLFGPKRIPSPAYWGLMAAEKDLETFIAIRKSWDTFVTDSKDEVGSSIPIGWVPPNSNPQLNWLKFLDAF